LTSKTPTRSFLALSMGAAAVMISVGSRVALSLSR
jgi:hypothetical protein